MNATENSNTCLTVCWAIAALAGLGMILATHGTIGIVLAIGFGLGVMVGGGALLQKLVCGASLDNWGPFEGLKGVPGWDDPDQDTGRARPAPAAPTPSAPAQAEPAQADSTPKSTQLPGQVELAERKGNWRYGGGDTEDGAAPARLDAARGGQPDDLKLIKGVGPKLESMLHEMGYFHFDQIAGWSDADVAWADEHLVGFKGRVSRDAWVEQARILAAGGETEFSSRAS